MPNWSPATRCVSRRNLLSIRSRLTVNERHARTIGTTFADSVKVAIHELRAANLQALLDDLRCKLIDTVFGSEAKDMFGGTTLVSRKAVLADVLDAPVAELAMSDQIDAGDDFVDARALRN